MTADDWKCRSVLRDLTDKMLGVQLPDQEFCRLSVPTNLSQNDRAGMGPVRLHATGCLQVQLESS